MIMHQLLAAATGAGAVLDDACGLPLLRAHYACQVRSKGQAEPALHTKTPHSPPSASLCQDHCAAVLTVGGTVGQQLGLCRHTAYGRLCRMVMMQHAGAAGLH